MRLQGIQKALQPFLYIFVTQNPQTVETNTKMYKSLA